MRFQSRSRATWCNSSILPEVKAAPTSAPMLVPATQWIGMPSSRTALITPICAQPRAPPPPRARPTFLPLMFMLKG